jgi:putative ABC transport system permease protein
MDDDSFDTFNENRDRIFRLYTTTFQHEKFKQGDKLPYSSHPYLPASLGIAMKEELGEVERMTHFNSDQEGIMRYKDKIFVEKYALADSDFFKIFSFPMIARSGDKVFTNKTDIVITKEIAAKYFGNEDPIGKTITLQVDKDIEFTVAGVLDHVPANSSLDFKIIVPVYNSPWYKRSIDRWGNYSWPTFIMTRPGTLQGTLKTHLDALTEKYMSKSFKEWREREQIPAQFKVGEFNVEKLLDVHMNSKIEWFRTSDPQYSFILGGIALLILIIACINYISLALTSSVSRRIEVGVRKVVGAAKLQLVMQFGIESILLGFVSMLIAIGMVFLFLPSFNQFTGKNISLSWMTLAPLAGISMLISLAVGVLAGSYPAFFISGFLPAKVLKGGFTSKVNTGFTKPLVVLQFSLSAFLVISAVIMYRQMDFITSKDLGYDKEHIIIVKTQAGWSAASDAIVQRFRIAAQTSPAIAGVTGTSSSFNQGWSRYGYKIKGENRSAYVYAADEAYIPLLNISLVSGRNFDSRIPSDSTGIIVNEALARDMRWKDPLSEHLNYQEDTLSLGSKVLGVMKDYHFLSLESEIQPMFVTMSSAATGRLTTLMIKLTPGNISQNLESVRKIWLQLNPDKPFEYTFLDQDVARQYEKYSRWMSIMGLATGFAMLIAALGLFGLAGINAVNRTKEVGIRKVMGAGVMNIFVLLNRQYIGLAVIAFAIAAPGSWYAMTHWFLAGFKFHIIIGWQLFVTSMLGGLIIALATVSYHAIRVSLTNPAETLKYE